jgi:hypothetical protein
MFEFISEDKFYAKYRFSDYGDRDNILATVKVNRYQMHNNPMLEQCMSTIYFLTERPSGDLMKITLDGDMTTGDAATFICAIGYELDHGGDWPEIENVLRKMCPSIVKLSHRQGSEYLELDFDVPKDATCDMIQL